MAKTVSKFNENHKETDEIILMNIKRKTLEEDYRDTQINFLKISEENIFKVTRGKIHIMYRDTELK